MTEPLVTYRYITDEHIDAFRKKGYQRRYVFPHRFYCLPKSGPDGLQMAHRMCGIDDPNQLWEIILYGEPATLNEFPTKLFFDRDIVWHEQHLGRPGQIATANLVLDGDRMYGMNYLSDLVQRISRDRNHKTRIELVFKGWVRMLLNAILAFAAESNIKTFYSPTAELTLAHTDPARTVKPDLFNRVYDQTVLKLFDAHRETDWWRIDVAENLRRIVQPQNGQELLSSDKVICICHDFERGLGHVGIDDDFAIRADEISREALPKILDIENRFNVQATYNVVGCILDEVRNAIEENGHAIAFHSYDHKIDSTHQLEGCRRVDYRIKGYRPPQSRLTTELTDFNLVYHNFEWLANGAPPIDNAPRMENRLVKFPILFDDYSLHVADVTYDTWEQRAIQTIAKQDLVVFSLHDCYAHHWLPHYESFLEKIRDMGTCKTLNDAHANTVLTHAV